MGHGTAVIEFTAAEVEDIWSQAQKSHDSWSGRPTFSGAILDAALDRWRYDEDGYGDPRVGSSWVTPTCPRSLAGFHIGRVRDGSSAVVPVAADEDVISRTEQVTVTVPQADAARIRALLACGRDTMHPDRGHFFLPGGRDITPQEPARIARMVIRSVSVAPAPKATATAGKLVTVYEIIAERQGGSGVVGSHASLAEARAAGISLMAEHPEWSSVRVTSRQVRRTEAGEVSDNLLVIGRGDREATVKIDVVRESVRKGATPAAYIAAFDYHE